MTVTQMHAAGDGVFPYGADEYPNSLWGTDAATRATVYVVDDDESMRMGLASLLGAAGLLGGSPVGVPGLPGVNGGRPAQVEQPAAGLSRTVPVTDRPRPATPSPPATPVPGGAANPASSPSPMAHPRGGPSRSHPGKSK